MGKGGSSAYYMQTIQAQQRQLNEQAAALAAAQESATKVTTPAVQKNVSSSTASAISNQLADGKRRTGLDKTFLRNQGVVTDNTGHRTLGGS